MRRRNLMACLAVVFAVVVAVATNEPARAAGYWNMPGTHAQRAGHGYGAGYHAPLILGPVRCDGWALGTPVRLPSAPTPYYGCADCGDFGRMVEAPSSLEGVVPTTAPADAPMPAAPSAPIETTMVEPVPTTTVESVVLDPQPAVAPARPLFDAPVQQ